MKNTQILVVDDQINTLKVISAILHDEGYNVLQSKSGHDALEVFKSRNDVDVCLVDLKMPYMDGLQLFRRMKEYRNPPPFLIMTAYGTIQSAVQALKEGVTDYILKPLDFDAMILSLQRAIQEGQTCDQAALPSDPPSADGERRSFHQIIGSSEKMKDIFTLVKKVAPTDAPVLIYGETGTGKELLAKAIHQESLRKDAKFISLNMPALTESLLEAELFGSVKGAYTGATVDKKGYLDVADGGTLFLDEIGRINFCFQSKLLRFLEDKTFEPVGSTETHHVDVRLIAATNLDLHSEVKEERFMSDLLYRIEVVPVFIPPLRERKGDIHLLVHTFIEKYAYKYTRDVYDITKKALDLLVQYEWPGNIRELENCIARTVILASTTTIEPQDLPPKIQALEKERENEKSQRDIITNLPREGVQIQKMEAELIEKTLHKYRGNKSLSSEALGISRKALYEKIKRHGINTLKE
ncbi:MAG: sigma-54 dependent transcriptional regulator [Desulfovermiculus sp.]|nr:sigma-54 dependent transcriptional regulator [Desulfovermiculus sp.]